MHEFPLTFLPLLLHFMRVCLKMNSNIASHKFKLKNHKNVISVLTTPVIISPDLRLSTDVLPVWNRGLVMWSLRSWLSFCCKASIMRATVPGSEFTSSAISLMSLPLTHTKLRSLSSLHVLWVTLKGAFFEQVLGLFCHWSMVVSGRAPMSLHVTHIITLFCH